MSYSVDAKKQDMHLIT